MKGKVGLAIGLSVGYVLGTRAGRERYEQMRDMANRVKGDPRVQEVTHRVAETVEEQAPVVKDKLGAAADAAVSKVKPSHDDGSDLGEGATTAFPARDDVGL